MQVVSVNVGERRVIQWKNKSVETGIFKSPTDEISLGIKDVVGDQVIDRKYHGGVDKACYLFSADAYPKFKELFPDLEWNWGMFGENVTISDLDEAEIFIGSQYQLGTSIVEVSEPRQPCYKLGFRFGNQKVLKDFIAMGHCGVYVRVLQEGIVRAGDEFQLIRKGREINLKDVFKAIYEPQNYQDIIIKALENQSLAASTKKDLRVL